MPRGPVRAAEIAIDPGSWTMRVATRGDRPPWSIPSIVARTVGPDGARVSLTGGEARARLESGGEHGGAVRPIRGGVVEDWDGVEALLRVAVNQTLGAAAPQARALVAIPADATETERRAWLEVLRAAGLAGGRLVPSGLAAALGAQLPISLATGSMIVVVGAGRTEAVVCSVAGTVVRRSVRVAGEAMDAQIAQWLRRNHNLLVSPPVAERIKVEVGAARPPTHFVQMRVSGRDLATGSPTVFDIHGAHVAEAVRDAVERIRDVVLEVLRDTPPELCADLLGSGVFLAGGGARLRELDGVLRDATGLPILLADHPERAVLDGLVKLLGDADLLDRVTQEG